MRKRLVSVLLLLSFVLLLSGCEIGTSKTKKYKPPTLEEYQSAMWEIDGLDQDLYEEYGIYPEDALSIIYQYCDEPEYTDYTFGDVDNAWNLLRDYVDKIGVIIFPFT